MHREKEESIGPSTNSKKLTTDSLFLPGIIQKVAVNPESNEEACSWMKGPLFLKERFH
jgi:hypothetical protein